MILDKDKVHQLMPILRLGIRKRNFIILNGAIATFSHCQTLWGLPDAGPWPPLRLNWSTEEDGSCSSGYKTEEQYKPVVEKLCAWLATLGTLEPEPVISVMEGWKIYFNGSPIGPKLDFYEVKGSKYYFPKEFYQSFPVFFDRQECYEVLKREVLYILDQLKLKGHYASLREGEAKQVKDLGFI